MLTEEEVRLRCAMIEAEMVDKELEYLAVTEEIERNPGHPWRRNAYAGSLIRKLGELEWQLVGLHFALGIPPPTIKHQGPYDYLTNLSDIHNS